MISSGGLKATAERNLPRRYARQDGIHVSPTFTIDGLAQADTSSRDTVADWVSRLLKN